MEAIEMCEDCTKRPAEVEIMYSNSDTEALCKKCYVYALRESMSRYEDRAIGDLVNTMRMMVTLRVIDRR